MKKISILLSLTLLFHAISGLCVHAYDRNIVSYPILYDFTDGNDNWQVRNEENSRLSVENEDGNVFMRLTALKGTSHSQSDTLDKIPGATVIFPDAFDFPSDASAIISVDIRTNDFTKLEKIMMINRDRISSDNVQYHLASLWGWTQDNKVNTYHEQNNRPVGDYYRAKTSTCFEGQLENNKWYTFRTEIFTDSAAQPAALRLSVYDGDTAVYEGEKSDITNSSLSFSNRITGMDIGMGNASAELDDDTVLDIDNISIVSGGSGKYWMVSGGDVLFTDNITIRFNEAVDEERLSESIMLTDRNGAQIPYTGEYNKSKFTYIITPNRTLSSGQYTINVDKAALGLAEDAQESCDINVFLGALPKVGECTAAGRIESGSMLTATAEYVQSDNIPGSCIIQWMHSEREDGEYINIPGATGTDFEVTDEYENSYIRFTATPITDTGVAGNAKESNILVPLLKPSAENVEISGVPMSGMEVGISYTFADPNGDEEGKSIYEWYVSADGISGWEKMKNSSRYLMLDETMVGKYLQAKVTPVSTDIPYVGNKVSTAGVFGPITEKDSINLVDNPGFETGTTDGWGVRNVSTDRATLIATQEDAYSGEWCARFDGQTNASTFIQYNGVPLEEDTAYIISVAMKLTPDCTMDNVTVASYDTRESGANTQEKIVSGNLIKKTEWTRIYIYCYAPRNAPGVSIFPVYWPSGAGYSVYIDDMYVAPLVIDDIDVHTEESINIPANGEAVSNLQVYGLKNQFGNDVCLENEKVYWTIEEDIPGVRVQDSKLYVSDNAVSGTIYIKAVCEPSFKGAIQQRFSKAVPIELVPHSDKTPKIKSISVIGETELNSVLQLEYNFYQVDGAADASTVSWYVADNENGDYVLIPGENGKQLKITEAYAGKFIKASVTPVDSEGRTGQTVQSNINGPAREPEAKQIAVTGKTYCGQILTGSYQYYDFNGDEEGKSILKWYRSTSENGDYAEIPGAQGLTYTIAEDDINYWIRFGVTPVSNKEPNTDKIYYSNAIRGPVAPTAVDLTIRKNGTLLTGSYKYESPNDAPEGETICEWYFNGKRVDIGTQHIIDSSSSGTIEFRVTPVSKTKPYTGEPVSTSYRVSGSTGSSGGSGGGGITSSKPPMTVLPELPTKEQEPAVQDERFIDITPEMDWAREAIEALAGYGIVSGKENGVFAPADNVTRAEFLKMLMSTLQIDDADAECDFSDVNKEEWYYAFVAAAYKNGIVSGYDDGRFGVADPITRQDAAVMIVNTLNAAGKELTPEQEPAPYADADNISEYAAKAIELLTRAGILRGNDGFFLPRNFCTRAQAAVMLNQIINVCGLR